MQQWSESAVKEAVFVWCDAWVLASVAVGGGLKGCQLKDIIAAGDLINRAIINATELRSGLAKLIDKGHVSRSGDYYIISGEARAAVELRLKHRVTSFSVMQFFEDFLDIESFPANDAEIVPVERPLEDLSDAQVEAATYAYRDELAALWRELRQIDKHSLPERALRLLEEASKRRRG
jgi:hypothetical protein